MELRLHSKSLISFFIRVALILIILHIFFSLLDLGRSDNAKFFLDIFDLDKEETIPTLFSAFIMLVCGFFLGLIALQERRDKRKSMSFFWTLLSIVFIFLALDEGARIHESVGDLIEALLLNHALPIHPSGFLFFPWVLPYAAATLLIGMIYSWFLLKLPRRTRLLFITAALVFLTGALGVEIFSAREADLFGTGSFNYLILYTIEETLEMFGMILFLFAIVDYIEQKWGAVRIILQKKTDPPK